MHIHRSTGEINIHVFIAFVFTLDVSLELTHGCSGAGFDTGNTEILFRHFSLPSFFGDG
jgi:hypothetical protein